jgi:hypothetical protein
MRRRLIALLLVSLATSSAEAQIIRGRSAPRNLTWASASVGVAQMQAIDDYATDSRWDFGTVLAWRASLERQIGNGAAVGIAGSLSRPSIGYQGGCGRCDAHANVFQVLGVFRGGGGIGLHQVIEIAAGVTGFSNFRQDATGSRLEPTSTVVDPTLSIGYGFGYAVSPSTQLLLVQDFGLMLHRRDGAPGGSDSSPRWTVTRLGIRLGLGR